MPNLRERLVPLVGSCWRVALVTTPLADILAGASLRFVPIEAPEKGVWYGDPFILDVSPSEITLLVEAYVERKLQGHIERLTIARTTGQVLEAKTVLSLPTHLSFPEIVRRDGEIFIHPENIASGEHSLFRYDRAQDAFVFDRLLTKVPLVDVVFHQSDGEEWLIGSMDADPYGRTLYFLKKQGDAYEATAQLRFPEFIARNAGSLFRFEGQLYRPAQICNRHYGEGVLLQPLNYDPHTGWSVGSGVRLHATDPRFSQGLHTFNTYENTVVVDCLSYRHPNLRRLMNWLYRPFRRFLV